jgi:pimeloyl-ACP methyl ester carboxylesterase
MSGGARTFDWRWDGRSVPVGYDVLGEGPAVLLLPAFSTVSTREELAPLAKRLADRFRTVAVDWPGFGRRAAPKLAHSPNLHLAFLASFVDAVMGGQAAVIAAGHSGGYVLSLARQRPGVWSRIVLVEPTWRGPLPTMMGGYRPLQERVRAAIVAPVIGPALYRLNVAKPVIASMYRRHVYADPNRITPEFIEQKTAAARRHGGRFGSAAFVTGALDPVRDRESFLALASPPSAPTLVVYGADTPPRSRAEMEALAALPGFESCRLDRGSLGVYEEDATAVADAVEPFLRGVGSY